MRKEKLQA
uniref:Uncharacterized protein n=1 Tax=Rhizophora mucronata TaxID=61149 RepID=A0A2P2Q8G2_RHIMU